MVTWILVFIILGPVAFFVGVRIERARRHRVLEDACLKMLEGGKKVKPSDKDVAAFDRLFVKKRVLRDNNGYYYKPPSMADFFHSRRG